MPAQLTNTVLMVAPTRFGFNTEAFLTNSFQNQPKENGLKTQAKALAEFNGFVAKLRNVGVEVLVFEDLPNSTTPDSIFPNNWFSTHQSGELITYPMAVPNRRAERRSDIIESLVNQYGYSHIALEKHEADEGFLEGTGSMLFDHSNKVVYAAISPRTIAQVLEEVAQLLEYEVVAFESLGKSGELIYHTNVMLCIGASFIAIGMDTIAAKDQQKVKDQLEKSGKEIIFLSNEQIYEHFAGNMLQVLNSSGEKVLVLSEAAYQSLSSDQLKQFQKHTDHFVRAEIPTIEFVGGGSARCMLAEVFI
ncbi:MAG: amidinotransferase [Crocinitomicaceae bacterium]|nr:amidinotransferase [Crocinitomicaceae bacterium]